MEKIKVEVTCHKRKKVEVTSCRKENADGLDKYQ
jgi:hypothetical protein